MTGQIWTCKILYVNVYKYTFVSVWKSYIYISNFELQLPILSAGIS